MKPVWRIRRREITQHRRIPLLFAAFGVLNWRTAIGRYTVVAKDPTCSDIPVVATTHTDECDVEMMDEEAETNAWLSSVNYQPTSLSWEQRVSQEEELVLLDEYQPAEKMENQSSVGMLRMRSTHWVV